MSVLNQIFSETETKYAEHDRIICEKILRELENIYHISFVGFGGRANVAMVLSFFTLSGSELFRNTVFELMEKYSVNKRAFLFRLLSKIYPPDFFNELQVLPNCLSLKQKNDYYELTTSYGILRLYRLTEKIEQEDVKCVLQKKDFHGKCHAIIKAVAPFFKEDFITTSKLNLLFGGTHYHSYIVCKDGSGVMDFSRNTFFSGTCFEDVFKPEIVVQYKASELEARFSVFQKEEPRMVNDFYPVLQLALHEEVKKYGKI